MKYQEVRRMGGAVRRGVAAISIKGIVLGLVVGFAVAQAHANVVITDFFLTNPMSFAFPGSTWATPVKQFQSFTVGGVSGQQVVPVGVGSPTVSGGAGVLGLNLNLSGNKALQLRARLLPANQAAVIQVLLFDADGTIVRLDYPIANFNVSIFNTAVQNFSSAITVVPGSTPGFDLSHVAIYEVQGNFFDSGASGRGTALFRVQLDDLSAVAAPEPTPYSLAAIGLICFVFARRFRRARDVGKIRPGTSYP